MLGHHFSLLAAALLFATEANAQWTRVIEPFPYYWTVHPGVMGSGISFFDVDEDGWDDITVASAGIPTCYYRNNQGNFELTRTFANSGDAKSCVWADIENDGDNDLIVSGMNEDLQIFINHGDTVFSENTDILPPIDNNPKKYCGLALGDINRDAFLDIAVANYSMQQPNVILMNNAGTGFSQGVHPAISSITATSFQGAFSDVDQNGYPEVFFCNDHNLGNEFYVLDTTGGFVDMSMQSGLYAPAYAMSSSWSDYDHDKDLDLFCSNSAMQGYLLMINEGEYQFDQDEYSELVHNLEGWGSLWIDRDNSGTDDLFICTRMGNNTDEGNNIFLKNNGGVLLDEEIEGLTDMDYGFLSNAKGDYNNDGRYDIIASPDMIESLHIFENTSIIPNHFLKFKLNGRFSNRNGFGVHYTCYSEDFVSYGYTTGGDNYLSQNSQNIIVGLGQKTIIDSLVLQWPSGIIDTYFNLEVDQFIQFTEAETIQALQITVDPCGTSNPTASVNEVFEFVEWSNGETGVQSIEFATDSIQALVSTGFGNTIQLSSGPITNYSAVETWEITAPLCNESQGIAHLHWSSYDSSMSMDSSFSIWNGYNNLEYTTPQGCIFHDTIFTQALTDFQIIETNIHSICPGKELGAIEIIATTVDLGGNSDTTTFMIEDVPSGWNSGIITNQNACQADWTAYVPQSSWNITALQPLCAEDSTGQILVEYFSEEDEFSSFSDLLTHLTSGVYQRTYESMPDGCPFQWELQLDALEPIFLELNYPNNLCEGDSFQLVAEAISPGEITNWIGPENGSWLQAGQYSIQVETSNGCSHQQTMVISNYETPEIESHVHYFNDFAEIEVFIEGVVNSYQCDWSNGMSGNEINVNSPGVYTYTITDQFNCVYSDSVQVEPWITHVCEPQEFISLNNGKIITSLPLTDLYVVASNGQLILYRAFVAQSETIELSRGVYLLRCRELKPMCIVIY